jgi:hypothetical protein
MNVNVPTDWDILEDPIYYTTINGQVVLYNDITREMYVKHETLAIVEDDDNVISFLGIKYDSISELIKALE